MGNEQRTLMLEQEIQNFVLRVTFGFNPFLPTLSSRPK